MGRRIIIINFEESLLAERRGMPAVNKSLF